MNASVLSKTQFIMNINAFKTIRMTLVCILLMIGSTGDGYGKSLIKKDSVDLLLSRMPVISIFKDNYFSTGIPLNKPITNSSSDVKFQISIKHRFLNKKLPFETCPFISYSQKSFWKFYAESKPFDDSNYNPTIGLSKFFYDDDDFLCGIGYLYYEHESNGQPESNSRTWDRITISYLKPFTNGATLKLSLWVPFNFKEDNQEFLHYHGFGEIIVSMPLFSENFIASVTGRKGTKRMYGSLETELNWKAFSSSNHYLYVQWFLGQGESMLHFKRNTNMLRVGINIKPSQFLF